MNRIKVIAFANLPISINGIIDIEKKIRNKTRLSEYRVVLAGKQETENCKKEYNRIRKESAT